MKYSIEVLERDNDNLKKERWRIIQSLRKGVQTKETELALRWIDWRRKNLQAAIDVLIQLSTIEEYDLSEVKDELKRPKEH